MKAIKSAPQLWQTNFMYSLKPRTRDQTIRFKFPYVSSGTDQKAFFFPEISEKGNVLTLALLYTRVKKIDKGWH